MMSRYDEGWGDLPPITAEEQALNDGRGPRRMSVALSPFYPYAPPYVFRPRKVKMPLAFWVIIWLPTACGAIYLLACFLGL